MMKSCFRFVLHHRSAVLIFCAFLSLLSLFAISHAVIATSIGKLFLGESPAYKEYLKKADLFGSDEILIIGIDSADLLYPERQERLRSALERIEEIPIVDRVESVLSAQNMRLEDDTLVVSRYADEAALDPKRIPELISELKEDSLAGGLIVSESGREAAVIVELKPDPTRPVEQGPRIVAEILKIFEEEGFSRAQLHRAGILAVLSEILVQTQYNLKVLFPIVVVILVATVWLLFRRVWPGVIAFIISMLAVIWTLGFAVLWDRQVDIIISMVPAVIFIVSFSDVVHLCSAYLIELGKGADKQEAIVRTAEDVGKGCFYTSITTLFGFLSLSLVPVPVFRKAGAIFGFGVAAALLLAMTLVPIMFSIMKKPAPLRRGTAAFVHEMLDWVLMQAQLVTTRRSRLVLALFGILLIISAAGALRVNVETDFVRRLGEGNPVRRDEVWFDRHFSGTNTLDIYVETPEPEGVLDAELFARVARLQDEVEEFQGVDKGISLVDLVEKIHRTLDSEDGGTLPTSRPALAQYLLLFEMGGGEDLDRFVDFERRTMRVLLRLKEGGFRSAAATGAKAVLAAKELLGESAVVQATGLTYLLGDWLDEILAGQKRGILFSCFIVSVMMTLAVRSLRAGLWAMVPNIVPLLVLGGYVGGFWEQVDSDTLMIVYVGVGVAVDDTIHFLIRYRIEEARCEDTENAIKRSFEYVGRAMCMTTVILVAGFLPFATSDYFTIHILGTLLPMCLVAALLADLLLLPAMVQIGLIRFRKSEPAAEPAISS
ncbi:MAG: hypothetical protein C4520_19015 [Candidatus Abyssobacteria bacterium SURF_5]|uniref:SSD domain-containing protein n=1 Tax=Abyssobacteria bacterium (strain SURF_5) TaxID=2093360 RepID=A0A3A4N209_ABYX5|nr:MAG: hypothetical protein C4520_19015 [Candidatus Abyssubacteria bacterium SURF_5]